MSPLAWKPQSNEVYQQWINDILTEVSEELNDWELSFVGDMEIRLQFHQLPTEAQAKKLEDIYAKYTK